MAGEQLPLFEGLRPMGAGIKLTGKAQQPVRALRLGETVIFVVKATVTKVSHEATEESALSREHTLKIAEAHELRAEHGEMVLLEAEQATLRMMEARAGQRPLGGEAA